MEKKRLIKIWNWTLVLCLSVFSASSTLVSAGVSFVHTDHLGAPQKMTNESGTVVWSADYKPFGEVEVDSDPDGDGSHSIMPLRFPGQYHDPETGLYYNYYRDYDASLGRYIQSDPIGLRGGMNTYAYSMQNPIKNIDPWGLWSFSLDGYAPFVNVGGGISFGQDPNGVAWFSLRGGVGAGGGIGFDPDDTSPAYDECYIPKHGEGAWGVYADAEVSAGYSAGVEAKGGFGPNDIYGSAGTKDGVTPGLKLKASVAAGFEHTTYLW